MHLLLVRHAAAVERGTPGIPDDRRALTPEGRQKFIAAARGLSRILDKPDVLFSSPLIRARQTAEIAREAWGGPKVRELEALATGEWAPLTAAVDAPAGEDCVALVGHEPHLSALLGRLLGTRHDDRLTFRKGGVALLEVPGRLAAGGRLLWFLPPQILRELGE